MRITMQWLMVTMPGGVLIIVLIMMNPGWIKITVIMTIFDDDQ